MLVSVARMGDKSDHGGDIITRSATFTEKETAILSWPLAGSPCLAKEIFVKLS
jgi:uncharacterized Zn-binding protein involved in type VI secretion